MKKSILNNVIYQTLYQVVKLSLPFITIPIVAKSFGPKGMGIISFSNSIMQYFLLFASLGIGLYFNRLIALSRNNPQKLNKYFWNIVWTKLIFSIVSIVAYLTLCTFIRENKIVYIIQLLYLVGNIFDISWFFAGIEDFKKTSLANLFVSILSFIGIIFFVHSYSDIYFYVALQGSTTIISQIILFNYLRPYKLKINFSFTLIKRIVRESFNYFLPSFSIMLYTVLNTTLLGLLGTYHAVGIMTNGYNLVNIIVTLVTTIDIVMLPRMSKLFADNNEGSRRSMTDYLTQNISIQLTLTIPITVGLISVFPTFVPWFFGTKFNELINVIWFIAPLVIIIPLGMSISRQFLIPTNRLKSYNYSVIIGAITNIIVCIALIPIIGIYGALFGRLLCELLVTFIRIKDLYIKTEIRFKKEVWQKTLTSSIVMFTVVYSLNFIMVNNVLTTVVQVLIGVSIYIFLNAVQRHSAQKYIIGLLVQRIRSKF